MLHDQQQYKQAYPVKGQLCILVALHPKEVRTSHIVAEDVGEGARKQVCKFDVVPAGHPAKCSSVQNLGCNLQSHQTLQPTTLYSAFYKAEIRILSCLKS